MINDQTLVAGECAGRVKILYGFLPQQIHRSWGVTSNSDCSVNVLEGTSAGGGDWRPVGPVPVYVAHIGHYPTEVSDQTFQLRVTYTYPIAPCDVTPITASGQTSSYDPPTPVWLTWGGSDGTNCSRHDAQFFKRNGNGWADCDHWTEYDCSFVELHAGAEPTYAYCWSDDAQFTRTGSQCEVGAAEINIPWIDVDDTIGIVAASSSGTFPRRSGL